MSTIGRSALVFACLCVLGGLCSAVASNITTNSTANGMDSKLPQPSTSRDMEETPSLEPTPPSPTPSPSLTSPLPSMREPLTSPLSSDVSLTSLSMDTNSVTVNSSTSESPRMTTTATEVVYPSPTPGSRFCPGEELYGISWPALVVGMSVNVNCQDGTASRLCTSTEHWDYPDLFDCLTPVYADLQNMLPTGPAPASITTVTSLAESALNATVQLEEDVTRGPEKLTTKDVKVLLDTLSFIATWSANQSSSTVQEELVKALKSSLMAVDTILQVDHKSFWTRVSQSADNDVTGLPIQLLQTVEALALQFVTVELEGGDAGEERVLVLQHIGLSYGLYDLLTNETLQRPSEVLYSLDDFHTLTGHTTQPQASIPAQFVYDRLHGNTVTRPLPYVYLVLTNVSQLLPCDDCESANLMGPPDSHVISLQLGVQLSCPRRSQTRLEGFHLDNGVFFPNTVTVLDEPRCVFYNYTARSWSTYAVKTRYDRLHRVVTCLTHHLTGFAIVKEQREYKELGDIFLFIYVGSAVLAFVAILGIIILFCTCLGCRLCKNVNNLIHLNLAVSMAASGLALIFGVHPIPAIQSIYFGYDISPGTVCRVSAAIIQFCAMSSFTWLMCEAILLLAVVTKLKSKCIGCGCFLFLFSWVLPAAPVVVAVLMLEPLTALSSDWLVCWPTSEWMSELAFWVPIVVFSIVTVIVGLAAAVLLCSQRKGLDMTEGNVKQKKKFSQLRVMTVGVFVLLVSMLCAWTLADLVFQYSTVVVVAALFVIVTPVQAFVLVVMFICQNNFCRRGDMCSSCCSSSCCEGTGVRSSARQRNLWAEENERTAKLSEVARETNGNGGTVAASADLKRNPSGLSTTSVTFLKRPVYIATPASNHETGSNSGDSITAADVELVSYTQLTPVDSSPQRSSTNDRAGLLAVNSREAETMFTNTGVAGAPPRADRSGTETSV